MDFIYLNFVINMKYFITIIEDASYAVGKKALKNSGLRGIRP